MKIYTGYGDEGKTQLFNGNAVDKDAQRVEAYGAVDELNAHLGLCYEHCSADNELLKEILLHLMNRMMDVGAQLATPADAKHRDRLHLINEEDIARLENYIDTMTAYLPKITHFILPCGCVLAAELQVARTVARRAERRVLTLNHHENLERDLKIYLNRLSDLLFTMARQAMYDANAEEVKWIPENRS